MSGHNKWSKIKNKKGAEDAKKGKMFTKLARMIFVAAREGGADPEYNAQLKTAIEKAKAENIPNDNIERALKKAQGAEDAGSYEELFYEGYGPEGVAVMVLCLTDNRNRTAPDVRHVFDKFGGNLGQNGSVSFMFDKKGQLVINGEGLDEESIMNDALEAGAEDFISEDGFFEILTVDKDFAEVRDYLLDKGYKFEKADISYIPQNYVKISDEKNIEKMEKLIDSLEDNDDVQEVYHNWDEE